jgi:hypothetical protein
VQLLLQLDANPFSVGGPVLLPNGIPGLRAAKFGGYRVLWLFNAASNTLRIANISAVPL